MQSLFCHFNKRRIILNDIFILTYTHKNVCVLIIYLLRLPPLSIVKYINVSSTHIYLIGIVHLLK